MINKKNFYRIFLLACLSISLSLTFDKQVKAQEFIEPTSCEMRLSLKPEYFKEPEVAYQEYWQIVKNLAAEKGLTISESKNIFKEKSQINSYYDTQAKELHKNNYILRERKKVHKGVVQIELTLKYRLDASKFNATQLPAYFKNAATNFKFEEDCTGFVDGQLGKITREISLSHVVKLNSEIESKSLNSYVDIFPELNYLGLDLQEPLVLLSGQRMKEVSVQPGTVALATTELPIVITVWSAEDSGEVRAAELSWKYAKGLDELEVEKIDDFFRDLQVYSENWLIPGQTKTSIVVGS